MTKPDLTAVQKIVDLVLEKQLAALHQAAMAKEATRVKIAALDRPNDWGDCSMRASAHAAVLYQTWVDARRRDLNAQLARQSVAVIAAEDASRLAFGRQAALNALIARR